MSLALTLSLALNNSVFGFRGVLKVVMQWEHSKHDRGKV